MPRLVRKAPLAERIKTYLDPWDWYYWLWEELNSGDWEDAAKDWSLTIGLAVNIIFMVATANAGASTRVQEDDVFSAPATGAGWLKSFMNLLVYFLTAACFVNAWFTFSRRRNYRLFEQPIEEIPSTPSAHRVRVDSSPMSSSPLRYLQSVLSSSSAESRAHPDAVRDVWEVWVWDPNPLCLQLFCHFSPLHVLLYLLNLPVESRELSHGQHSVKLVGIIFLAALISVHLYFLRSFFTQQAKDQAIINSQVMGEYNNKFVHPALQHPSRDVGVQVTTTRDASVGPHGLGSLVETHTPTTVINRGFRPNPNPSYASQYDPDDLASQPNPRASRRQSTHTPSFKPLTNASYQSTATTTTADLSSPIRQSHTPGPFRQPQFQPHQVGGGDGGSLGVYSHAASPLRKAASTNYLREERSRDSLGGDGRRREGSPIKREGSPLKRMSTPGGIGGDADRRSTGIDRLGKSYSGWGVGRRESGRF